MSARPARGVGLRAWLAPAARVAGTMLRAGLDAALPRTCLACGNCLTLDESDVCIACAAALASLERAPYCPRCGRNALPMTIHERGCVRCRSEPHWNVARLVRIGPYDPPLRGLVLGLKYAGIDAAADFLGRRMAARIAAEPWAAEIERLVAVPMHWRRRWQRPNVHARLLAEGVARELRGVELLRGVRRRRYGPSQTDTPSRAARFENVRGCFDAGRWAERNVRGRTVCIIDNLVVSGATLHELSKLLRRMGAKRIYAAIAARSTLPGDPQPVM